MPCGCCEGTEVLTPMTTANRPGLPALSCRVGTHATFLETMKARLSNLYLEIPEDALDDQGQRKFARIYPLRNLKTRSADDPAIALLDSWAVVADVLTFYQERIANEGYLHTATERRSILELARLIGYALRPGVASTVYLAYTLDEDRSVTPPKPTVVTIPAGARVQSLPGPSELPQSFETSDDLEARSAWNNLQVRLIQPQIIDQKIAKDIDTLYFEGIGTNLRPNDPLLLVFGDAEKAQIFRLVDYAEAQPADNRTKAKLQGGSADVESSEFKPTDLDTLLKPLQIVPLPQRANALRLPRSAAQTFSTAADIGPQLLVTINPNLKNTLYRAWSEAKVTKSSSLKNVGTFRVKAALFGHNAPLQLQPLSEPKDTYKIEASPTLLNTWGAFVDARTKSLNVVLLDAQYDGIKPDSWIVIERPVLKGRGKAQQVVNFERTKHQVDKVNIVAGEALGINARVTMLTLKSAWLNKPSLDDVKGSTPFLKGTTVYAKYDQLSLAEESIEDCVGHDDNDAEKGRRIELDRLYDELNSGRWLIVSGERADVLDANSQPIPGVIASELVMLANVEQSFNDKLPDEKTHSTLILDKGLAYCYKRDTVQIYGNVVKATHGETRNEVLGGGDGSKALQQFTLRQPPLTFVSAPNPSGVDSTLQVHVNDVLWHETDSLAGLMATDRKFITRTDDDGKTTVIFGNGQQGARLPTGPENVKAVYRNGIGKPGNVKAGQITLLATRPLGVKAVTNPLRASGGADKESRDQARQNAPLAVMALDRLVSTQDYADFARTFAGIGKASAVRLSDAHRQLVHVTIAGADDIAIEKTSDLYRNLVQALHDFGDPYLPIQVDVRELLALIISANVRVLQDYQWESVEPEIRAALLDKFGFQRQELGQPVFLSEVVSAIQRVPGVAYVDVDVFNTISEAELSTLELLRQKLKELTATTKPEPYVDVRLAETVAQAGKGRSPSTAVNGIYPAQLVFVTPDVPATLILNEVTR